VYENREHAPFFHYPSGLLSLYISVESGIRSDIIKTAHVKFQEMITTQGLSKGLLLRKNL